MSEATKFFANIRPDFDIITAFRDNDLDSLSTLSDKYSDWVKDPIKRAQFEYTNYQNNWELTYDPSMTLTQIRSQALNASCRSNILDEITTWYPISEDEIIHCQLGTSESRAEAWMKSGLGITWLEGMTSEGEGIGLQVNCPELEDTRSEFDRIYFYASQQAGKINDTPVMLEFDIPAKYIYGEGNRGEFAVPQSAWMQCRNFKITTM